jgi:hypothetical protein
LAIKAKNESTRVAAIRELLDRGYGKSRLSIETTPPASINPMQLLMDEIAEASRNEPRCKNYGE